MVENIHTDGSESLEKLDVDELDVFSSADFNSTEVLAVVWESGPTSERPDSPPTGTRYFDTDDGQPIWYTGSDWVYADGTSATA